MSDTAAPNPDSRRRVALLTHSSGGGLWAVVRFLHEALSRSGDLTPHVILAATSWDDALSRRLVVPRTWMGGPSAAADAIGGVSVLRVGADWPELEGCRYRPSLAMRRALAGVDLVHVVAGCPAFANLTRGFAGPVLLQAASMAAFEREAVLRGRGPLATWRRVMTRWTERLDARGLGRADGVLVLNRRMFRIAEAALGQGRVTLAYPGVDTARFHPATRLDPAGPLVAVGRFTDPRKNAGLLIHAYARVIASQPSPPDLWVVSSRGLPPHVHELSATLGVSGRVRVLSGVPDEQLPDIYRRARAFVLSSDEEGLGIVVVEAMASGLPVVATDCVGPRECVVDGQTGRLTPVGDADAMAAALRDLLSDPAGMARMGGAARARALATFDAARNAAQFLERYRILLAPRGGRG